MSNPILTWLRGDDLKQRDAKALTMPDRAVTLLQPIEYVPPLIHGPGTPPWGAGEQRGSEFNSAVFACLRAIADAYVEAPIRVYRDDGQGNRTPLPDHPLQALIARPNPFMDWRELAWYWTWCKNLDGNAYLVKNRAGTGLPVELWPVSPTLIAPYRAKGSTNFLDGYLYRPTGDRRDDILLDPADVIHLKLGLDDADHRLGLSPIKRLVREVAGDQEATRWAHQLLSNGGSMGMMVTPPDGSSLTLEQARALEDHLTAKFTGEGRGRISVLAPGAKAEPYGFSPEQMDVRSLHYIPETRVAAVMRVPAVVAGLAAGLEKSGQFSNMREAREQFAESTILPAYQFDAAKLNHSLAPEFTADRRVVLDFDVTEMRVLQEDMDAKIKRLSLAVGTKPFMTVDEARADIGLEPLGGDNGVLAPPEPAPPALPEPTPGQAKLLRLAAEQKALGGADLAEALLALVDLSAPRLERQMDGYFDGLRKRTNRRVMGG